jgi:hypothetical protein
MGKRKVPQYSGKLGRPLTPEQIMPGQSAEQVLGGLVRDLCAYYRIPSEQPLDWERLALALAFRHVPAFQFPDKVLDWAKSDPKKGGRKSEINYIDLVMRVDERRASGDLPKKIFGDLKRAFKGCSEEKLRRRYNHYKPKVDRLLKTFESYSDIHVLAKFQHVHGVYVALKDKRRWAWPAFASKRS